MAHATKSSPLHVHPRDIVPGLESSVYVASQLQLMWWKFRRHRLAMLGGGVTILIYLIALFVEFLAPYSTDAFHAKHTYAPPQILHWFERTDQGIRLRPYVYGYKIETDSQAMRRTFTFDTGEKHYMQFFVRGTPYKLWGLFSMDLHLLAPKDPDELVHLLGADRMGRDVLSRLIYGTRVSMSIGLIGVAISFLLGILLGGISGYYGGLVDNLIQRFIEFLRSIPTIPLWLGLAAALPPGWPSLRVYFGITIILSFLSWTGLARVVRGRFLSLRTEDFVLAARLGGSSEIRTIVRHMVPSMLSHIIATLTLAIPQMILSETALSFLGLGIRPPAVSWGVLLRDAQSVRALSDAPWLLWPGMIVVVAVLALNFLGDGLRDAADPYAR